MLKALSQIVLEVRIFTICPWILLGFPDFPSETRQRPWVDNWWFVQLFWISWYQTTSSNCRSTYRSTLIKFWEVGEKSKKGKNYFKWNSDHERPCAMKRHTVMSWLMPPAEYDLVTSRSKFGNTEQTLPFGSFQTYLGKLVKILEV